MKITRKLAPQQQTQEIDTHRIINNIKQRKQRRTRRYITNTDKNKICFADELDKTVNNPYNFTYADPARNTGYYNVLKNHYDIMFHNYGVNLCYFRRYYTFFKEGEENHANMVYGEDTTAEYYLSSDIRAYLNITKQDWQFNMMGFESQEEIEIWITIQEFRTRFSTVIGEVSSNLYAVPVTADLINHEYYGTMDTPEFFADIYGKLSADTQESLYLTNVYPEIAHRPINSIYFKSLVRNEPIEPLTGTLKGQLTQLENDDYYASGYLKGEITYHSLYNIEGAPGWNLAPQVGDFFRLKAGEIEEDYEINQVIDKQMGGNDALNMFLQRYVFRCKAVRRMASEEEIHKNSDEQNTPQEEFQGDQFIKKEEDKRNIRNTKTNKLSNNIYHYKNDEDNIYGGYGNSNDPKLQDPIFQNLTVKNPNKTEADHPKEPPAPK